MAENVGIEISDFAIRLVDLADFEKTEEELNAALAAKVWPAFYNSPELLDSCVSLAHA